MRRNGLIALIGLTLLLQACQTQTHPKLNPTKAEVYYQLWIEAEADLKQCVEKTDKLGL